MCDYCKGKKNIPLDTDVSETWIEGNTICNAYSKCKIRYCPMCGSRLKECNN